MMGFDTTRHLKHIEGIELETPVHIVGCGSIGTAAATTMARLGFTQFVGYDEDIVEKHNIANQFFETTDLGKLKTDALEAKLKAINPEITFEHWGFFDKETDIQEGAIYIVGTDNMASRTTVANAVKGQRCLLIDGRMGGNEGQVHAVFPTHKRFAEYQKTLYTDGEAADLLCTERSVIYTISIIGGLIGRLVLSALRKEFAYKMVVIDMTNIEFLTLINAPIKA